jgi:hypothetical protein
MSNPSWEERLKERHLAPPPAPSGEWEAIQAAIRGPQERAWRPWWVLGGGLALAGLAMVLVLPGQTAKHAALAQDEDPVAVEQWVSQQWSGTQATAAGSAKDSGAEPGANLLALMDTD